MSTKVNVDALQGALIAAKKRQSELRMADALVEGIGVVLAAVGMLEDVERKVQKAQEDCDAARKAQQDAEALCAKALGEVEAAKENAKMVRRMAKDEADEIVKKAKETASGDLVAVRAKIAQETKAHEEEMKKARAELEAVYTEYAKTQAEYDAFLERVGLER